MAKLEPLELKEFNDNVQILLRMKHVLGERLPSRDVYRTKMKEVNVLFDDFARKARELSLFFTDCACLKNSLTRTGGYLPQERGFKFDCAICSRRSYAWSEVKQKVIEITDVIQYVSHGTKVLIETNRSSWIQSIKGTWNAHLLRVEDVLVNDAIHYPYIPYDVWEAWEQSSSKGKFFHDYVRYHAERGWGLEERKV